MTTGTREPATDGAYRHRKADPSPNDGAFLRTFLVTGAALLGLIVAVNVLVDPLGAFETGLFPSALSRDRDLKATLFRRKVLPAEVVIMGSSRVQRLDPSCLRALTTRSAFNFGVTAGSTADYLAILRFMRQTPAFQVRQILLGVEPETFQGNAGITRALNRSRALRRFITDSTLEPVPWSLGADLLGWQSLSIAVRSIGQVVSGKRAMTMYRDDGFPAGLRTVPQVHSPRVQESVPSLIKRYASFPQLEPTRVAYLRTFLDEAKVAGIDVIAFIPPVHPSLSRAAEGTTLPDRTAETVALLREFEAAGFLRYVETRDLAAFGGDSTLFTDAIHMDGENATRLLTYLVGHEGACAVQ